MLELLEEGEGILMEEWHKENPCVHVKYCGTCGKKNPVRARFLVRGDRFHVALCMSCYHFTFDSAVADIIAFSELVKNTGRPKL